MAGTSSATVVIKLKVEGNTQVAAQLAKLDSKLASLQTRYNGIAGQFEGIAKSFDSHSSAMERHNKAVEDNGIHIEAWSQALRTHRDEQNQTRRDWSVSKQSLSELGKEIGKTKKELVDFDKEIKRTHNQTLISFDKELKRKREDFAALNKEIDKSTNTIDKFGKSVGSSHKKSKDNDLGNVLTRFFKPGIKFAKIFGIEFAAMTAVVGGLQAALWIGQVAVQAYRGALTGLGAAAGIALGGLSALLAAQRELNTAKLAPLLAGVGGPYTASSKMAGTVGNPKLAQFSKAVPMIVQSAAEKGQGGGAGLSSMMQTLGDIAITAKDPNKALSDLSATFLNVQKSGKFSKTELAKMGETFPALAKGIKEFQAGSKSSKFSVDEFFAAFQKGDIEALKPFIGTLDKVNDTLIGRFQSMKVDLKEQFTEMGKPLLDLFKKPLANLQREITIFIVKVGKPIQNAFERIFAGDGGSTTARVFDKIASLVITSLAKMEGFVGRIRTAIFKVRQFFDELGGKMRDSSRSWDGIFENILKPLGSEIWKTITYALEKFNQTMGKTASYGEGVGGAIREIFEVVRKLIDALSQMKIILAPIMSSLMSFIKIASGFFQMLGPIGPLLAMFGISGKLMGGGKGIFKAAEERKAKKKGGAGGAAAVAAAQGQAQQSVQAAYMGGKIGKTRKYGKMSMLAQPLTPFGFNNRFRSFSPMVSDAGRLALGLPPKGALNAMADVGAKPQLSGAGFMAQRKMTKADDQAGLAQMQMDRDAHKARMAQYRDDRRFARSINRDASRKSLQKGLGGADSVLNKFKSKFSGEAGKETGKLFAANAGPIIASYLGGLISGKGAKTSNVSQGFGGLLSGAGMGASMGGMVGSVVPGIGTALGAGIGAVAGGAMGLFKGIQGAGKERKRQKEERIQAASESSFAGVRINDIDSAVRGLNDARQALSQLDSWKQVTGDTNLDRSNVQKLKGIGAELYDRLLAPINEVLAGDTGQGSRTWGNITKLNAKQLELIETLSDGKAEQIRNLYNAVKANNFDTSDPKILEGINAYETLFGDASNKAKFDLSKSSLGFDLAKYDTIEDAGNAINNQIKTLGTVLEQQKDVLSSEDKMYIQGSQAQYRYLRDTIALYPALLESGSAWKDIQEGILKGINDQTQKLGRLKWNLNSLTGVMGITAEEAAKLATSAGYDLSNSLLGASDALNLLGYAATEITKFDSEGRATVSYVETEASRATAAGRILRDAIAPLLETERLQESADRINALGEALFDAGVQGSGVSGFVDAKAAGGPAREFLTAILASATERYQNTPGMSFVGFRGMLDTELTSMIETKKSLLAGRGVKNPEMDPAVLALEKAKADALGQLATTSIGKIMQYDAGFAVAVTTKMTDKVGEVIAEYANIGEDLADPKKQVEYATEAFIGMVPALAAQGITGLTTIDRGKDLQSTEDDKTILTAAGTARFNEVSSLILGEMGKQLDPANQKLVAGIEEAVKNISVTVTGRFSVSSNGVVTTTDIFAEGKSGKAAPPSPAGGNPFGEGGISLGDTSTSRLQRTLSRHAMFNSSLPGNRTITSSLRNFNLGSPSSDHATGAAYDLTGDNLGQYAQSVNDSGGFAEFHGSAGSRHLHVVPPQGDTASPMSGSVAGGAGATNTYNIQVVARDNATAQEVAQLVMKELSAKERSMKERA